MCNWGASGLKDTAKTAFLSKSDGCNACQPCNQSVHVRKRVQHTHPWPAQVVLSFSACAHTSEPCLPCRQRGPYSLHFGGSEALQLVAVPWHACHQLCLRLLQSPHSGAWDQLRAVSWLAVSPMLSNLDACKLKHRQAGTADVHALKPLTRRSWPPCQPQ